MQIMWKVSEWRTRGFKWSFGEGIKALERKRIVNSRDFFVCIVLIE